MLSSEDAELYEVTCVDCNSTKSYFTAQGVNFFKANHEGHKIRVKEPGPQKEAKAEVAPPLHKHVERSMEVQVPETVQEPVQATPKKQSGDGPTRLGSLVVDVVDEEKGRAIKVYGIAGGIERFVKSFSVSHLADLNYFLESGRIVDRETKTTYVWSPDKVDISPDVARMLDEGPAEVRSVEPQRGEVDALNTAPEPMAPEPVAPVSEVMVAPVISAPPQAEILQGERSHIQSGEEHQLESRRVSQALKRFRWKQEAPYVVGAVFDDLLSVQSQNGTMMSAVIDAVAELGYTFLAVEAPNGCVTAWFKKATLAQTPGSRTSSS
jgi:hypothetical protein